MAAGIEDSISIRELVKTSCCLANAALSFLLFSTAAGVALLAIRSGSTTIMQACSKNVSNVLALNIDQTIPSSSSVECFVYRKKSIDSALIFSKQF